MSLSEKKEAKMKKREYIQVEKLPLDMSKTEFMQRNVFGFEDKFVVRASCGTWMGYPNKGAELFKSFENAEEGLHELCVSCQCEGQHYEDQEKGIFIEGCHFKSPEL